MQRRRPFDDPTSRYTGNWCRVVFNEPLAKNQGLNIFEIWQRIIDLLSLLDIMVKPNR